MGNNNSVFKNDSINKHSNNTNKTIRDLPDEVIDLIIQFVCKFNNDYDIVEEIKNDAIDGMKIFNAFKKKNHLEYFTKKKKAIELIKKYNYYQSDYELYIIQCKKTNKSKFECINPILNDVLFTGCNLPYADHSHEYFTDETFIDLKTIIHLFPSCLKSTFGRLRCRYNVPPLYAACINSNIPMYVIKYLIKNGADINQKILVNGYPCEMLEDLNDNNYYRFNLVKDIFIKYKNTKNNED